MKLEVPRLLALSLALTACATTKSAPPPSSAATLGRATTDDLAGLWTGAITGRETWTSSGSRGIQVALRIASDGSWTMTSGNGEAAGISMETTGDAALLVGTFTEDGPHPGVEALAFFRLHRADVNFLIGSARAYWRGVSVHTGVHLRRARGLRGIARDAAEHGHGVPERNFSKAWRSSMENR
jgi:hypothetical protein